jgi:hypothetical protein
MPSHGFETRSVHMEPMLIVSFQAPTEDIDRIMDRVVEILPLVMGTYDSNAFQSAPGVERYRPRAGAAAGAESELRRRPGIAEVSFQMADDHALLAQVIEAIFQIHSYQEPVITVRDALVSRSKGLDDRNNPHRWWNTTGDWKKAASAAG